MLLLLFWMVAFAMQNVKMREQMSVCISIVWMFSYLCIFLKDRKSYTYLFTMVLSTITINVGISAILAVPLAGIWYLERNVITPDMRDIIMLIVKLLICICFTVWRQRIPLYKMYKNKSVRILSAIIGVFLVILEQTGLHLLDSNRHNFSVIIGNLFIFSIIIGILWLLDHYRLAAGKLKVEQDNRRMNTSLHKTKELMPLLDLSGQRKTKGFWILSWWRSSIRFIPSR